MGASPGVGRTEGKLTQECFFFFFVSAFLLPSAALALIFYHKKEQGAAVAFPRRLSSRILCSGTREIISFLHPYKLREKTKPVRVSSLKPEPTIQVRARPERLVYPLNHRGDGCYVHFLFSNPKHLFFSASPPKYNKKRIMNEVVGIFWRASGKVRDPPIPPDGRC